MTEETRVALERAMAELALSEARIAQRGRLIDATSPRLDRLKRRQRILGVGVVVGLLAMVVMVATGYVPPLGWDHNPEHAARFGLIAGLTAGMSFAALLLGPSRARQDPS